MKPKTKNTAKKIFLNILFVTIVLLSGFWLLNMMGDTLSVKLLFLCIILDYILGNSLAMAKISKHGNGELSSKIGLIGIIKKIAILFLTIISIYVDRIFLEQSLNIAISNIVIISFIFNEILSIVENAKKVNIKLPTNSIIKKIENYQNNTEKQKEKENEIKKNDKNNNKIN